MRAMDIPQTRWATTIDGATIAYQDVGQGDVTLVVINGWISHLEVYWEQPRYARFMQRLAGRFRVLTFDKRGVGMSDRFQTAPDIDARMDDVRAVMEAAGVERAAIFGWGTAGPALAAVFAASHPDQTLALITDPNIQDFPTPDFPFFDSTETELDPALLAEWGNQPQITAGFDDPPQDPAFVAWMNKLARYAATPTSYAAAYASWMTMDIRSVLPTVRVPALVISKRGSKWGGPDAGANVAARIPGARHVTVEGQEGVVWVEDPDPYVRVIEAFLEEVRGVEADLDRVLATVLFTDIVESTATAAVMGDAKWRALLIEHDGIAKGLVERYRGMYRKSTGDGLMATFDGPARAIRCAQSLVECVRPLGVEIRAGAHTGEITVTSDDIGGIGVHVAARVAALAGDSEVWASSTVKDLTAGSGLTFEDAGEHELKGVPDRWHLYRVVG